MPTYKKWLIGIAFVVCLCVMSYSLGYIAGRSEGGQQKQEATVTQEATAPSPSYLISADLFIPNFNACASLLQVSSYQWVQGDYIEFVNGSQAVAIVGKGDPAKLDSIMIMFPKYHHQAYIEGYDAISATISAVSPSTDNKYRGYIMEQLGLAGDINGTVDNKLSEYNGIRYAAFYDTTKVTFLAMPIPKQ